MYKFLDIIRDYLINGIVDFTQCEPLLYVSPYFHWVLLSIIVCVIMHVLHFVGRLIYWNNSDHYTLFCNWEGSVTMRSFVLFTDTICVIIGPVGFLILTLGLLSSIVHIIFSLFNKEFRFF